MTSKYLLLSAADLFPDENSTERKIGGILDRLNSRLESVLDVYMDKQREILQGKGKKRLTDVGKKEELGAAFRTARDAIKTALRPEFTALQGKMETARKGFGDQQMHLEDVAVFSDSPARQFDGMNRLNWYREFFAKTLQKDSVTPRSIIEASLESENIEEAAYMLLAIQTAPATVSLQVAAMDLPALISRYRERENPEQFAGFKALERVVLAFQASKNQSLRHLEKTSGGMAGGVDPDPLKPV